MKITEIDKNFKNKDVLRPGMQLFNVKDEPFRLYGFLEPYRRIPEATAKAMSNGAYFLHTNTAGGRVRFRTDSDYVVLKSVLPYTCIMPQMTADGSCGFDMYADGEYCGTFAPKITYDTPFLANFSAEGGYEAIIDLKSKKMRDIIINFPLYNDVSEVYVGIAEGAKLLEGGEYKHKKPIVFYGSSITQGGCASRPGNSYESILSRWFDTDFKNLGFSGNARAEDAIAEYISTLDMSVFVYDYDHNAPTAEHLLKTHYKMYKTIRDKNPKLPIILASAPVKLNEGWLERFNIIKGTYEKAKKDGDENIYLVSGQSMIEFLDPEIMTVDGCHPNDFGFFCMAKAFGSVIEKLL